MEVPTAVSGEKPHISVFLSNKYDKEAKYFHCNVCGKVVFGYYTDVKIVASGTAEFTKAPLQVQCHGAIDVIKDGRKITTNCKAVYLIG